MKFNVPVVEVVGSVEDGGLKKFAFVYFCRFSIMSRCLFPLVWSFKHSFPSWKCLCLIYTVYTELMIILLAPSQSTIERLGLWARFLWMLTLNAFFYSFCIKVSEYLFLHEIKKYVVFFLNYRKAIFEFTFQISWFFSKK